MHTATASGDAFDFIYHVHTFYNFRKDAVAPALQTFAGEVQEVVVCHVDEELRGSRMWRLSTCHCQRTTGIFQTIVGFVFDRLFGGFLFHARLKAAEIFEILDVPHHVEVVSAHRTPDKLFSFAETAEENGYQVIIAGAGGAAHLPGMIAAKTLVPVLGVPVQSAALSGVDSLYSIVQMPRGIPVGTLAIGKAGAANAALLAAQILAQHDAELHQRIADWRKAQTDEVLENPDPRGTL